MSWTLIEHQALTSSVASVTLGSGGTIPQTYKTLKLVLSIRGDRNVVNEYVYLSFNGSTSSFTRRNLRGNGSTASSGSGSDGESGITDSLAATSSTFGNMSIDIPNYSGSTNKPISADSVSENNATSATQSLDAVLWSNTAAITSITISNSPNNWVANSTFTLYGLA